MISLVPTPSALERMIAARQALNDPATAAHLRHTRPRIERLLGLGAAGVVTKPFDPIALPDEIRRIVARAGRR